MNLTKEEKIRILEVEMNRLKDFIKLAEERIIPAWDDDTNLCPVCKEAKLIQKNHNLEFKCEVCCEVLNIKKRCDILDNILSNLYIDSHEFWRMKFDKYGTECCHDEDYDEDYDIEMYYFDVILNKFLSQVEDELENVKMGSR